MSQAPRKWEDLAETLCPSLLRNEMEPFAWPVLIGGAVCVAQSTLSLYFWSLQTAQAKVAPSLRGWLIYTCYDRFLENYHFIHLFIYFSCSGSRGWNHINNGAEVSWPWDDGHGVGALWLWRLRRIKIFLSWFISKVRANQSVSLLNSWTNTFNA